MVETVRPYTPAANRSTSLDGTTRDPNSISPSTPSSPYKTDSGSLYTLGLPTRTEEDKIKSLARISKRNGALMKLEGTETPSRSSFEVTDSPLTKSQTVADGRANTREKFRTSGNQRSLRTETSAPTDLFLQGHTGGSTNNPNSSGHRQCSRLSRKESSIGLQSQITGDIWEEASQYMENIEGTQPIPDSNEKGIVSRSLRTRIGKSMWKPQEGMHVHSIPHISWHLEAPD
jgi:hypothetical protein